MSGMMEQMEDLERVGDGMVATKKAGPKGITDAQCVQCDKERDLLLALAGSLLAVLEELAGDSPYTGEKCRWVALHQQIALLAKDVGEV